MFFNFHLILIFCLLGSLEITSYLQVSLFTKIIEQKKRVVDQTCYSHQIFTAHINTDRHVGILLWPGGSEGARESAEDGRATARNFRTIITFRAGPLQT